MAQERVQRSGRAAPPRSARSGQGTSRPAAAMRSATSVAPALADTRPAARRETQSGGTRTAGGARPRTAGAKPAAKRGAAVAPRSATKARVTTVASKPGKRTAGKAAARGGRGGGKATGRTVTPVVPPRVVKIKELNAQGKCGPGTSVVHLFRVDEVSEGRPAVHLVFFDRHGWYCEHGRSCPAVEDVRKLAGPHLARTFSVG